MLKIWDCIQNSMYASSFWDGRIEADSRHHVDWLCDYETAIIPLCKQFFKRPKSVALVLGSGVSSFPEEIYDA